MALDAFSSASSDLFNFIIYDTLATTPIASHHANSEYSFLVANGVRPPNQDCDKIFETESNGRCRDSFGSESNNGIILDGQNVNGVQGRRKRRRRPRICKNKEEAETQRMTHIAVERNRRKQMNEHLAVLRSLMPESFLQRGDQASTVGGAIEFVKELEHILQSLEAQKFQLVQPTAEANESNTLSKSMEPPFSQFFVYPQYTWSQTPNQYASKSKAALADIEVTLIETHANLRILSRRSHRQLSKLIAGLQTLCLTILHLNVTTVEPLVLFSINAKVEEGSQLTTVDDIATAVHHLIRMIEEEAALCCC